MNVGSFEEISKELESDEYKEEYNRHLDILNSFLRCMFFIQVDCSMSTRLRDKLFCLSVIDDIFQSIVAIKCLAAEGIRNSCRRELRYLIELSIKACLISQKQSEKNVEEQISEFQKTIESENISMIKQIDFYFFDSDNKAKFITETKRIYGELCLYVHSTPSQMQERIDLNLRGRQIGSEGTNELKELNDEIGRAFTYVLMLFFHAIPSWCVGDYIVEKDGATVNTYFSKSKYFSIVDRYFDYKCERQDKLETIESLRLSRICF